MVRENNASKLVKSYAQGNVNIDLFEDGTKVYTYSDDVVVSRFSDGREYFNMPNGLAVYIESNGEERWQLPNGATILVDQAQKCKCIYTGGYRTEYFDDGRIDFLFPSDRSIFSAMGNGVTRHWKSTSDGYECLRTSYSEDSDLYFGQTYPQRAWQY